MEPITVHTGTRRRRCAAVNVDTDQIIPAVYLKRVTRTGFEDGLFAAWRNDPDFVLNRPECAGRDDPGRRAGLRHRLVPRARRLGAAELRVPGRRLVAVRRHLPRATPARVGCVTAQRRAAGRRAAVGGPRGRPGDRGDRRPRRRGRCPGARDVGRRSTSTTTPGGGCMEGLDDVDLTLRHADEIAAYEAAARPGCRPRSDPGPRKPRPADKFVATQREKGPSVIVSRAFAPNVALESSDARHPTILKGFYREQGSADRQAVRQLGSKKAATDAVDAVVDTITRSVAAGERVAITGFGVFEKVARPARVGSQPAHRCGGQDQEDHGAEVQGGPGLQGRRQRRQEAAEGRGRGSGREGGHRQRLRRPRRRPPRRRPPRRRHRPRRRRRRRLRPRRPRPRRLPAKKAPAKKAPAKKAPAKKTAAKKAVKR